MSVSFLQLNASTRDDRHAMTWRVKLALSDAGAAITDARFFSNVSLVLTFEIDTSDLPRLGDALRATGLALTATSDAAIASASRAPTREARGTLQITFVHDEPDLERDVPAVPG